MNARTRVWALFACASVLSACFETKVINANSSEDGGKSNAASGNTGAGGASSANFNSKACISCEDNHCANEASKCRSTSGCGAYLNCLLGCSNDASCVASCAVTDANATTAAAYLATCAVQYCSSECVGSDTGLGGSGGLTGSGGLAGSGGSKASGGSPSLGGVTGNGGQSSSGVTWLTFDGSAAPAALAPNTDFGIDGVIYGYDDGCATLVWDEATRCATGTLCSPGPTFANWGAGVGFDFRNTGKEGLPPNTKRTWNPTEHGVRGIAWEITGTAPALQLWVLNMDPMYQGECSSTTCDIAGPPDGTATPSLSGQLLFSNMRKDDWGGSGIVYTFDPALVHALQFKLPAVIAGAASFSFCVNRIGLVR